MRPGAKLPLTATTGNVIDNVLGGGDGGDSRAQQPSTSDGVINPLFVSDLFESPSFINQQSPHHRTGSSASSSKSTVITNTSSTGGLLPASSPTTHQRVPSQQRTLTTSSVEVDPTVHCADCYHFHQNHHRRLSNETTVKSSGYRSPSFYHTTPTTSPQPPPATLGYAPYPPSWYYLLSSDSKRFRKHRHSHYRKNCKTCQEIVRHTFEQYYLHNNMPRKLSSIESSEHHSGNTTPDISGHYDPLLDRNLSFSAFPFPSAQSNILPPRNRANCGHSCLKYSILFYSCVVIILSICFICYLTKMFGALSNELTSQFSEPTPLYTNGSLTNQTNSVELMANDSLTLLEIFRMEVIGIVVSSAIMIVFFLGMIGAFLESVLCLRIFGAILSYLFLLTFGGAFYIIILLVISHVPLKLILSTISCAAVGITIHALLAIAPFAFADLISREREDEKSGNNTYIKYPSVRFLPPASTTSNPSQKRGRSYFSLRGLGRVWSSRTLMYPPPPVRTFGIGGGGAHMPYGRNSRTTTNTVQSSPRTTPTNHDNQSGEDLIPTHASQPNANMVRFNDNWI